MKNLAVNTKENEVQESPNSGEKGDGSDSVMKT